ncbi:TIGR03862 family flavoprotein [Xanthomonadaceae bacterium XH05]|nr:TIGR03862 family flavoprotein [Xanthomonadaceae bacterium XH05]
MTSDSIRETERNTTLARHRGPIVAIIGGGPAGLIAARVLAAAGAQTTLYDAMPSVGRKFLLAGKGGLNLTHSEPLPAFITRYGDAAPVVAHWLQRFGPDAVRQFARELGVETFIGSSGRVFPADMKAGPMMRTWVRELREAGVTFRVRHRFTGWLPDGRLHFDAPEGETTVTADLTLLALGGGSWAKLGSDGAWVDALRVAGIPVAPLRPANCGFDCTWSENFAARFEGQPLKAIAARAQGEHDWRRGELIVTRTGIEGSLVYALSAVLRDAIDGSGEARFELDLFPDRSEHDVAAALAQPRGSRSRSEHWRRRLGLAGIKAGLLHECVPREQWDDADILARIIKKLPLVLERTRPIDEAISTAGGIRLDAMDQRLMLRARPGTFVAGEMLDWEAPTGGYLLTACLASGVIAAEGALAWWREHRHAL